MRLLVVGSRGQLGSDLVRAAIARGVETLPMGREDADITVAPDVGRLVAGLAPDVIVNTSAWTDLPGCEQDPARAFAVNAIGAHNIALAATAAGARLIHVSTDYVFDGMKGSAYTEGDARRALNVYGASKLAGEDLVLQACPAAAIVRVSGLFGIAGASGKGGNFVETMLRLAREGRSVSVVADQVTSPTFTQDIAEALLDLASDEPSGEYHLAAAGSCSWFVFARAIFEEAGLSADLHATTAAEYGGPVVRPACSALASTRVAALPVWRDGLQRYLRAKGHIA